MSSEGSIQLVMSCGQVYIHIYIYTIYAYLDADQVFTSREGGVVPGRTGWGGKVQIGSI